MKTKSKALILALCAVLLVTASVFGTMAYLTSTDEVKNTFTVGSVAITMDEKDVDQSTQGADRDQANSYKLLPGHEYEKDPTIHVDPNSEDCYLFVKVENGIEGIEQAGTTTVANQMAAKGWKLVRGQTNVYVYVGTADANDPATVSKDADVPVFEKIAIAGTTVDNDTLKAYEGKTITVTAYAVQKDGFEGKSAADIWAAAFPTV